MATTPRIRRRWDRALRCAPAIVFPTKYTPELMELVCALGGPTFERAYVELRRHPDGKRLLRERPDLPGLLKDRDALAALPEGSLGRTYFAFTEHYRFDAAAFEQVHQLPAMARRLGWDDALAYVMARGLQLHDVWHALGDYGADLGGEVGVTAFTNGQIPNPGTKGIVLTTAVAPGDVPRKRWRSFVREAEARGRDAELLTVAPYEELLDKPINEVRDLLGIAPTLEAHPDGVPYCTSLGFGLRNTLDPYQVSPAAA